MKFPLSWLKTYLPTDHSAEAIAAELTSIGLEVEHLDYSDQDVLFTIGVTPNLAHCHSIRGIARELAGASQEKLLIPQISFEEEGEKPIEQLLSVTVSAPDECPRYACRMVSGVKVASSPPWLQQKLTACGVRSVNNVVDVTNLVMLELGQPLHAFDFKTIQGGSIEVRMSYPDETLTTLDGKTHVLTDGMLVICDCKAPIALAGVMGALHTEVSDKTSTVLLEAAYFEPTQVRRTRKRLDLSSEASYRFERGVDPNAVREALDHAAALVCALTGGKMAPGVIDKQLHHFEPRKVGVRLSRINRLLGVQLSMNEVVTILGRIDLKVVTAHEDLITVSVPTYRHDVKQEVDLIEEVARFYGYNNIHKKERPTFRIAELAHAPAYLFEMQIREALLREGLQELLTCDLIGPKQAQWIPTADMPQRTLIHVLNPRSQEQSIMRPSLLPGHLSVVKHNHDHQLLSIAAFEVGRVHFKVKENYVQQTVASLTLAGKLTPHHWDKKPQESTFFDLKGLVEELLRQLHIEGVQFQPSCKESFHPGRQASIVVQGMEVGVIGQVHPCIVRTLDVPTPIYFAELNIEDLLRFVQTTLLMKPLALYPSSTRDWTVTVHHSISAQEIASLIEKVRPALLEEVCLLDLYHSEKLGSEWKNMTWRFTYRDPNTTVALQTVEQTHHKITTDILKTLQKKAKDE